MVNTKVLYFISCGLKLRFRTMNIEEPCIRRAYYKLTWEFFWLCRGLGSLTTPPPTFKNQLYSVITTWLAFPSEIVLFYSLCLAYSSFCCLINFSSFFEIQLKHLHMCIIFPVSSPKSLLPAMSIKNLFSPSSALPKFVYISVTVLLNSSDLFTCFLHTRKLLRAVSRQVLAHSMTDGKWKQAELTLEGRVVLPEPLQPHDCSFILLEGDAACAGRTQDQSCEGHNTGRRKGSGC